MTRPPTVLPAGVLVLRDPSGQLALWAPSDGVPIPDGYRRVAGRRTDLLPAPRQRPLRPPAPPAPEVATAVVTEEDDGYATWLCAACMKGGARHAYPDARGDAAEHLQTQHRGVARSVVVHAADGERLVLSA